MNNFRFPLSSRSVIDVTKPPYNVDNTGKTDCTATLCKIIDDVLSEYGKAFEETQKKLSQMEDPNGIISFEIRKVNGLPNVIFPEILPESKIIYFPDGIYLVSDTVSYTLENFRNILGGKKLNEMNCRIRLVGQSRDGVVIRLKDNSKGFEYGTERPVISFMRGEASNIAMTNMIENLTIDIGSGNPGAIGLVYFANNTGAVRNILIKSSDPEGRGHTGFAVLHDKVSACYVKGLEVSGFDYGIRVLPQTHFTVFEHIYLHGQHRCGFFVGNTIVSVRDYRSENQIPAMRIQGAMAFVTVTDSTFVGGSKLYVAIQHEFGQCHFRNIRTEGYRMDMMQNWKRGAVSGENVEFCSHGPVTLYDIENPVSLSLPVKETPQIAWEEPEKWVCVEEFGAVGDGITDDTSAIQKAFNSGAHTVWFQPGRYKVNSSIHIPASVNRINFMYCDLVSGEDIRTKSHKGVFVVDGESDTPLLMEDLFAWEGFWGFMTLVDHACKRTLIMEDIHAQAASLYFNSVSGGKVFLENVGCTVGGVPGAGARDTKLPGEEKFPYSRETACFHFVGQEVYARQINPERSLHEVINDGGLLWVLGFKTEEEGTAFDTLNGGRTEVLGGSFCIGLNKQIPLIINNESNVSVFGATCLYGDSQRFPIAIREIKNGEVREMYAEQLPIRFMTSYTIPMYIGRCENQN